MWRVMVHVQQIILFILVQHRAFLFKGSTGTSVAKSKIGYDTQRYKKRIDLGVCKECGDERLTRMLRLEQLSCTSQTVKTFH